MLTWFFIDFAFRICRRGTNAKRRNLQRCDRTRVTGINKPRLLSHTCSRVNMGLRYFSLLQHAIISTCLSTGDVPMRNPTPYELLHACTIRLPLVVPPSASCAFDKGDGREKQTICGSRSCRKNDLRFGIRWRLENSTIRLSCRS